MKKTNEQRITVIEVKQKLFEKLGYLRLALEDLSQAKKNKKRYECR